MKSTITSKKENTSKKGEKIKTENRIKYGPIKNSHKKKRMSKNNTKNMKSRTDLLKHLSKISRSKKNNNLTASKSVNKEKNKTDDIINLIQNNSYLYEKISYLQLWWKTIYQIIKIQKYLRGFLYRIKLLRLLELKEKIVYGTIQLSNFIKKRAFKNIISSMQRKILYNYYNKWNNLAMKKIILRKLKFSRKKNIKSGKKRKNDRNKRSNKLKSGSLTKRDIHRSQKTEGILPEKMQTIEKSTKTLGLSPSHSINNELTLSSKKGFETSRINTEKNIRSIFGNKNNSMEKRSKKNINNNLTNIKSNKTLKNQKSSKKSNNHLSQASYNFIKNNSHNQINNYKFSNTINSNAGKMSKKNTNVRKGKKINRHRNKKLPSDLDKDMNKFNSYNSEPQKNKLFNGIKSESKKNSELEYISKHENRFHCPKQLYTLNKKKGKNSSFKIEKLDISFDSKTVKNEESENNIRSRSLETRHKKKIKSFVENINDNNKKSSDDTCLDKNNFIKKSETEGNHLLKSEDKGKDKDKDKNDGHKTIVKSKTKTIKKIKKKIQSKKNIKKKENKQKNKNDMIFPLFNIWKCKYIKRKIINKLRGISILNLFIKFFNTKNNGALLIKNIQNVHKYEILKENFNIYRNIIFTKFILQKLKEKIIEKNKIIDNKDCDNKDGSDKNNNNNYNSNQKNSKVNIIEISPDHTTKINNKLRNNFIKNEIFKKLQKLLIIKQRLYEHSIMKKYYMKWKILTDQYNPNRKTEIQNYYSNIKESNLNNNNINDNNNENRRTSSSCHKKTIKHQPNLEFSFNEENNKLYNKKIVNYINNNNNISVNKDDYLNKSQPKINNYHIFDDISINKEDYFNNTQSQINNYNKLANYNNFNDFNGPQGYSKYPNLTTCSKFDEPNNINININLITKSPYCQGIYKKKKVNYKNSLNKNINNSCVLREVNKSNFELDNTMEKNNEFLNNSMVMGRRRKNNANIYYPKKVSPNLEENESVYGVQKIYIHDHPEIYNQKDLSKNFNNNMAYQKINIRYQKMNYNNDLDIANKQIHFGANEEQENEEMNN